MQGVFLATNLLLFYVFWELMLVPAYLLVGMFGGPRRAYAAIKFVLYTAVGSLLMLVGIIAVGAVVRTRQRHALYARPCRAAPSGCATERAGAAVPGLCGGVCRQIRPLPAP